MTFNKCIHPAVGADLSAIDGFSTTPTIVGADLSRTQPIHRPWWLHRYPDLKVKQHYLSM